MANLLSLLRPIIPLDEEDENNPDPRIYPPGTRPRRIYTTPEALASTSDAPPPEPVAVAAPVAKPSPFPSLGPISTVMPTEGSSGAIPPPPPEPSPTPASMTYGSNARARLQPIGEVDDAPTTEIVGTGPHVSSPREIAESLHPEKHRGVKDVLKEIGMGALRGALTGQGAIAGAGAGGFGLYSKGERLQKIGEDEARIKEGDAYRQTLDEQGRERAQDTLSTRVKLAQISNMQRDDERANLKIIYDRADATGKEQIATALSILEKTGSVPADIPLPPGSEYIRGLKRRDPDATYTPIAVGDDNHLVAINTRNPTDVRTPVDANNQPFRKYEKPTPAPAMTDGDVTAAVTQRFGKGPDEEVESPSYVQNRQATDQAVAQWVYDQGAADIANPQAFFALSPQAKDALIRRYEKATGTPIHVKAKDTPEWQRAEAEIRSSARATRTAGTGPAPISSAMNVTAADTAEAQRRFPNDPAKQQSFLQQVANQRAGGK